MRFDNDYPRFDRMTGDKLELAIAYEAIDDDVRLMLAGLLRNGELCCWVVEQNLDYEAQCQFEDVAIECGVKLTYSVANECYVWQY